MPGIEDTQLPPDSDLAEKMRNGGLTNPQMEAIRRAGKVQVVDNSTAPTGQSR
jgi:hypothetical protein